MDTDDQMIGRILSRREVLKLLGAAGIAALAGCAPTASTSTSTNAASGVTATSATATAALNAEAATAATLDNATAEATAAAGIATAEAANTAVAAVEGAAVPACVVRPEVTEGPYYVEENLVRADVRSDSATGAVQAGMPLTLTFNVSQVSNSSCAALAGATVEIWHCNAEGAYSDVTDRSFDTVGQDWLRGAQVTDANGMATFTTIYPGWYSGRAVHIHFKVRPNETQEFTSQLFFEDALSQQVFTQESYAARGSTPDVLNSADNIYEDLLLLSTTQTADGYAATFPIGIDLSAVGSAQESSGGAGEPGGPPPRTISGG